LVAVAIQTTVWFETHSTTEDNEQHIATGWHPGQLSDSGRRQAADLGQRIRARRIGRIYASDLGRAVETARLAAPSVPLFLDWRLRECNYGNWNGADANRVHGDRGQFLDQPYPGGESWRLAVQRVGWFVEDLYRSAPTEPVLIVGHVATRLGLSVHLGRQSLEDLLDSPSAWKPGWFWLLTVKANRPSATRGACP
jgi:broad specificity phosphatase PhoE